jgi:hypothetical protein
MAEEIKITGVILSEVGQPRNDGTPGSALYEVPFKLSSTPSSEWVRAFIDTWNSPPRFSTMHRPGIARVEGDRVVLDGTTMEEVERWHLTTLKLCVEEANKAVARFRQEQDTQASASERRRQEHLRHVEEVAKRLRFE